jgi:fluoride exporter
MTPASVLVTRREHACNPPPGGFFRALLAQEEGAGMSVAITLWVAVGSAIGGVARYWCSGIVARLVGETFPWGTLIVNVVGSFLIGLIATVSSTDGRFIIPAEARQFLMVGILGGFTTFSSFSLQTLTLARDGQWLLVGANIVGSVVLCLVMVWAGYMLGALINR